MESIKKSTIRLQPLLSVNINSRISRQENQQDTDELKKSINYLDSKDIYRTLHLTRQSIIQVQMEHSLRQAIGRVTKQALTYLRELKLQQTFWPQQN